MVNPQTKKIDVKGALMLALKTAAIPITIKFMGIILAFRNELEIEATSSPKKAPIKRLGAKTPPSPPEASVNEVTMGFKSTIAINVSAKEKDMAL